MLTTRPRLAGGDDPLAEALRHRGATVVERPLTHTVESSKAQWDDSRRAVDALPRAPALLLASGTAAPLARRLVEPSALAAVVAVGTATAQAAEEVGFAPVELAPEANEWGLLAWVEGNLEQDVPLLSVRSRNGTTEALKELERRGYQVLRADLYGTDPVETVAPVDGPVDWITLLAPSAARALQHHFGDERREEIFTEQTRIAVIGASTAKACDELGLEVHCQPATPSIDGLVEAMDEAADEGR